MDFLTTILPHHGELLRKQINLFACSDAAPSEGMCYVLTQWKDPEDESLEINIVSCARKPLKEERGASHHSKQNWLGSTGP